jgi:hypothetical protein
MARWRTPENTAPERLRRFVAAQWPHGAHGPATEWMHACLEWLAGDPGRRLPFGEHGDAVDVICESARIKIDGLER